MKSDVDPSSSENVPAAQGVQSAEEMAPSILDQVPAGQASQESTLPVTDDHVPGAQLIQESDEVAP